MDIEDVPAVDPKGADEWAHVEIMGHRSHWGRVTEVSRFGASMLRVDVPTEDPEVFTTHFYSGSSIFSMTPCTEATAREYGKPRNYRPLSLPRIADHYDDEDPPGDDTPDEDKTY